MKETEKIRVIILTGHYRILGDITITKGRRLTDHIVATKQFIPITDAEVIDPDGRQVLTASFLDVHRDRIEIIVPDEPANLIQQPSEFP